MTMCAYCQHCVSEVKKGTGCFSLASQAVRSRSWNWGRVLFLASCSIRDQRIYLAGVLHRAVPPVGTCSPSAHVVAAAYSVASTMRHLIRSIRLHRPVSVS